MGEPKSFCRRCKAHVDFIAREDWVECPVCGQSYAKWEVAPGLKEQGKGCLRALGIFILILVGLCLLALAFLYAACSHMNL